MVAVPFLEKGISMATSNRRSFSEEIQRAISEPHQAKQPNCESDSNHKYYGCGGSGSE
jgi:hypothetical protein